LRPGRHSGPAPASALPEWGLDISPGRMARSVLEAMSVQPPAADDPAFLTAFSECLTGVRSLLGVSRGQAFVVPGSGTQGMEMIAASLLRPGSTALVACTGVWGDRWAEICGRHGIQVCCIEPVPGEAVEPACLARAVAEVDADAVLLTHVDPSTGVRIDVAGCAAACRDSGALVMVDGVWAAGVEVVRQSEWGVDLYLATGQNGLGVPSGLVVIGAGERAVRLLQARAWRPRTFSLDLQPWLAAMDAVACETFSYHQSPAGHLVLALREGLRLLLAESADRRAARHAFVADVLRGGLEALGVQLVVPRPASRALGVSVCRYPEEWGPEFLEMLGTFGVRLPDPPHPALGPRTFRIRHLGAVNVADAGRTLEALARASGNRRSRYLIAGSRPTGAPDRDEADEEQAGVRDNRPLTRTGHWCAWSSTTMTSHFGIVSGRPGKPGCGSRCSQGGVPRAARRRRT
jgi:alanine-glyoxylate transaminase/serine-glyoxylate transaminase/serine-pyruvate transaminase